MNEIGIHKFAKELECKYKEERYSVRDNGAIYRHPKSERPRKLDCVWTFGTKDKRGYMNISGERVHRIVATAFHGEPPTPQYVVDHIDTNKQNNRYENLRWVTRFENILLNPITVKRIESACGCSIEEFLNNPSKFRDKFQEPDLSWMRKVSEQEAKISLDRLLNWAKSDKTFSGGSLGEWVFSRGNTIRKTTEKERVIAENRYHSKFDDMVGNVFQKVEKETGLSREELSTKTKKTKYLRARVYAAKLLRTEMNLSEERISTLIGVSKSMVNSYLNHSEYYLKGKDSNSVTYTQPQLINTKLTRPEIIIRSESLTLNAVQGNWKTPCEFLCCPNEPGGNPIEDYFKNLTEGKIFYRNQYGESTVFEAAIYDERKAIVVISQSTNKDTVKPWGLTKITFDEGYFVHTSIRTFFSPEGAQKQFALIQGLEWTGGDSIDDYC